MTDGLPPCRLPRKNGFQLFEQACAMMGGQTEPLHG